MANPNWVKGHKKVGGRKQGTGAMSIEEFRKILNKCDPNFIRDYIRQAKSEPTLARSIFDRLVPEVKDPTIPTTIIINNHIP